MGMATFTMAELSGKSTDDLRKLLRANFPDSRGDFASVASAAVCADVLSGARPLAGFVVHVDGAGSRKVISAEDAKALADAKAVSEWKAATSRIVASAEAEIAALNAAAPEKPEIALEQAAAVANKIGDPPELAKKAREVSRQIAVMRPDMAKVVDDVIVALDRAACELVKSEQAIAQWKAKAEETQIASNPDPTTNLVAVGGEVTVAGVKVQKIMQGDRATENAMQWVPQLDPHFRFDFWRGLTKTAGGKMEFTAADVIGALLSGCNLHLFGDPGVGKTTLIEQFCAAVNWPFFRVQGDKFFQPGDLVGEKTVITGNISFQYGPLATAMQVGGIFVADEIDYFPASCKTVFNPILEPNGALVLGSNGGEIIRKHPNFRFVCTSNTQLFGDPTGKYPDTQIMNAALISRIGVSIHAEYMTPMHEASVLVARSGVKMEDARQMVELANASREGVENQNLLYALSLRHLVEWGRMSHQIGLVKAFACTCLTKVPPSDATVLMELAQRHLGDKLKGL